MSYITKADPYLAGNSKVWKNWQSQYDEPRTCKLCEEERHGKIYPFSSETYVPAHMRCRCEIIPMRTQQVGTATSEGWNGADAWLMYRGRLPDNYITKEEATDAGWKAKLHNLAQVCPGKYIGDEPYQNKEGKLPNKNGRIWYEADFDYQTEYRGENRILYSNDGLIFVSYDHAKTFYELVK